MLLTSLSVLAASLNGTLLHTVKFHTRRKVYYFNLCCTGIWIIILLSVNQGFPVTDSRVWTWGIMYGGAQVLFLLFKTLAMSTGPVSVTTLIGNCSLLLSTAVSVYVWKEPFGAGKAIGLLLLVTAVFMCTYTKTAMSYGKGWKIYCIGFFIFAASVGIIFKYFSFSECRDQANDMMAAASIIMFGLLVFLIFIDSKGNQQDKSMAVKEEKIPIWTIVLCGLLSCFYNRLNIYLTGSLPGAFFYPVFNGGTVFVSFLLSKLFFNERMEKIQIFGMILGILAIIIVSIF